MADMFLALIVLVVLYVMFKVITSTLDIIFKVAIGLAVLSLLGYYLFGFTGVQMPVEAINQTAELNNTDLSNETIPINNTEFYENITIKEKNTEEA